MATWPPMLAGAALTEWVSGSVMKARQWHGEWFNAWEPLHNSGEAVAVGSGWATRRLFAANSKAIGKKNNATGRPSPLDHRPQGVMQRLPWALASLREGNALHLIVVQLVSFYMRISCQ